MDNVEKGFTLPLRSDSANDQQTLAESTSPTKDCLRSLTKRRHRFQPEPGSCSMQPTVSGNDITMTMSVEGSSREADAAGTSVPVDVELSTGSSKATYENVCSCPNMAALCAMLERLACSNARFVSQQRGEKELTVPDKMRIAHCQLHRSPASFLNQFGPFCCFDDLEYLRNFRGDDQTNYLLAKFSRNLTRKDRLTVVKNRRYSAVTKLEAEGFFDEDEMKRRDPLLYEQMVGRFLPEEELKAEADRQMRDYRFSSWLLEQVDSRDTSALYHWQLQKEQQQTEENESDESDEELDSRQCGGMSSKGHRGSREGNRVPRLDESERQALREEFLHIMQERFIDGEEREFDYRQVDENEDYDDLELVNADAEARYFDDEEPETMALSDSSPPNGTSCDDAASATDYDY